MKEQLKKILSSLEKLEKEGASIEAIATLLNQDIKY